MDKKESLLQQKIKAEKEIAQLQNQQKIILNKQRDLERHARNHRLIVHGAIMEGVFPFTASMDGEPLKAFLIDLSRLPATAPSLGGTSCSGGLSLLCQGGQNVSDKSASAKVRPFLTAHLYTVPVSCALPGAVASCGRDGGCRPQTPDFYQQEGE